MKKFREEKEIEKAFAFDLTVFAKALNVLPRNGVNKMNIPQRLQKQQTNVVSIGTNKRFVRAETPPLALDDRQYTSVTVAENQFGFAVGDALIVRKHFLASEITPQTMFVTKDYKLTVNADHSAVLGIVVAFQRNL